MRPSRRAAAETFGLPAFRTQRQTSRPGWPWDADELPARAPCRSDPDTDDGRDPQAAFDAQRELAHTGRHRAEGIADLLTAVLAAEHRLTILQDDADFEIAAEALPFEHRWVLPRGTV